MLVCLHATLPPRLCGIRQIQITPLHPPYPLPLPQGHCVVGPIARVILLTRHRLERHEPLWLPFLPPLAIRPSRHPSPPALKNLFTAVCNATSCPRTIITITTDQLTARTRRKSGSFTRKRSLPAVDLSSRLSRRIIASFLPHCLSLLPSPLWCYRTLNFLPLPTSGGDATTWAAATLLRGFRPWTRGFAGD